MKKLIAFLLLAFAFSAHAITYYFSDCQVGKDTNCVAGSDAADGLTPATAKQNYTSVSDSVANTFKLANGGSWILSATNFVACNTCVLGASVVWEEYTPTWCVTTCASTPTKPLVTQTGNFNAWEFSAGTTSGAIIRNIKIVGPNSGTGYGVYMIQPDQVTLSNVDISGFYIGVFSLSFSTNVTITNSSIHDNLTQGFLGAAQGLLIENNTLDNNGFYGNPIFGDHNIYLTANAEIQPFGVRTIVRGNTLTRSARCTAASTDLTRCPSADGLCKGTSLVVHRVFFGLVIENNVIDETTAGAAGGCYGISVVQGDNEAGERYDGAIIRGNKIINAGDRAIDISNCPYCVVENNIAVWTAANAGLSLVAINAANFGGISPYLNDRLVIRNNSVYIGAGSNASWVGVKVANDGANHRVFNNVVYLAAGTSSSMQCYSTLPFTAFTTWDYNLCFRSGGVNTYSNLYANLAAAQAAGMGVHDSVSDPTLTAVPAVGNGWDIAFTNGLTKNGGRTPCPNTTFGGLVRTGTCDIGAHQQGASVLAPSSPTGVH